MGLRELHCSLARTDPGVPLVVLGVEGDLDAATRTEVESLAQYRLVSVPWRAHCRDMLRLSLRRLWACCGPDRRHSFGASSELS